jgi:ABC-2 type transport system permease protein
MPRAALLVAGQHLKRLIRKPGLVLLLALIPLTLAVIQWAAFGRLASDGRLPPIRVLVLDDDQSFASGLLLSAFEQGELAESFEARPVANRQQARRQFQRGQASALVHVPEGFQRALLERRPVELGLVANPLQTFSPRAAEAVLQMLAALGNGVLAGAREPLEELAPLLDAEIEPTPDQIGRIASGLYRAVSRLRQRSPFEAAKLAVQRPEAGETVRTLMGDTQRFFAYLFPGLVLFTLLFISELLARRLLRDRLSGLTRRLAMGPVDPVVIVIGGALYLMAGLLSMLVLLGLVGKLVLGIQLRAPVSLLLIGIGFSAFGAGLMLLLMGLLRSERSVSAVASVVILALALVGGSFVPIENYPDAVKSVAVLTPNGAAHQAFVDVLLRVETADDLSGRLAVIWGWGLAALLAGVLVERGRLQC